MRSLKLIGFIGFLLFIIARPVQAEEGMVTTNPPLVKPSDLSKPFTVPVGPRADNGKYDVTFNVQCDDTNLSVNGAFDDATDQNGAFDMTTQPATKSVEYVASTQGKLSNVTITVVSSDTSTPGQCTASIWRPSYTARYPLTKMCFGGDFLTSLFYNITSFIPNIKGLGSFLLAPDTSGATSKQIFKLKIYAYPVDSRRVIFS